MNTIESVHLLNVTLYTCMSASFQDVTCNFRAVKGPLFGRMLLIKNESCYQPVYIVFKHVQYRQV